MTRRSALWLLAAAVFGSMLGLVDTRPGWDDAGITVGLLVILSGIFGAVTPAPAWMPALAVGCWIPILNAWKSGSAMTLFVLGAVVLLIACVAAYGGRALRYVLS